MIIYCRNLFPIHWPIECLQRDLARWRAQCRSGRFQLKKKNQKYLNERTIKFDVFWLEFTGESDWRGQFDQGDIVLQLSGIPLRMHSEVGGDYPDLSSLNNVLVMGAKNDFERGTTIGTVSGSQNPIGRDKGSSAEPRIVNDKGHLPG